MMEKRTFSGAVKALVPSANGEEKGLIGVVEDDLKEYKEQGLIPAKAPENLRIQLLEMTCDAFIEVSIYLLFHTQQIHSRYTCPVQVSRLTIHSR